MVEELKEQQKETGAIRAEMVNRKSGNVIVLNAPIAPVLEESEMLGLNLF